MSKKVKICLQTPRTGMLNSLFQWNLTELCFDENEADEESEYNLTEEENSSQCLKFQRRSDHNWKDENSRRFAREN